MDGGTGELLAFGASVWYSGGQAAYFHPLAIQSADGATQLRSEEYMAQAVSARSGSFALRTNEGWVYFGRCGHPTVYQVRHLALGS